MKIKSEVIEDLRPSTDPADHYRKDEKKSKRKFGTKVAIIAAVVVIVWATLRTVIISGLMGLLLFSSFFEKPEVVDEIHQYQAVIGNTADENYRNKWGMSEEVFPSEISDTMSVNDFKMVYYNPWDAQYLSYLVVDYEAEDYAEEVRRLRQYPSTLYQGYYGVQGFLDHYELLAIEADSYQGFVYALTDGAKRIIYVELIFCNYYMDLDYQNYIPADYLPVGFDAAKDNQYRKRMLRE